jgi:hypothetical protein
MKERKHHNNIGFQGNKSGSRFKKLRNTFKKFKHIIIKKKY